MGTRSATTLKKRQKELARMEKQRDKAARRLQRKAEKLAGGHSPDESIEALEPDDADDSDETPTAAPGTTESSN
jgi:hypothetical protein